MNAETVLKVRELVHANWLMTIGEVVDEVGVLMWIIEGSSYRRTMVDTALFSVCCASAN